ncbi:MAG: DUF4126 domain-containing protein [Terrimicrobiaceae bacterium]|nr:DUF4126 domain-containing protein [Terrimicrobiaceae bacterium]
METLELLGAALGLATLAGINLYLTVFISGLAIQQGWITLHPQYEQLAVLGDPVIVGVAGTLFVIEFFADKVPWVDSLWDSVHTFIRPVGGAMLAVTALGVSHPVYSVVVGLLAGGMALAAHGAKAGTRLLANASPEPFSNIGLSLAEDATVLGGLALIYTHPIVALVLAVIGVCLTVWLAPRIFGAARAMLWFAWRRVSLPTGDANAAAVPELPPDLEIALHRARGEDAALQWAAPCVSGRGEHLRGNIFGWLLLTGGATGGLDFARNAGSRPLLQSIPLDGWKAMHRRGMVCDRVVVYRLADGKKQTFQFDRSRRELASELVRRLNARAAASVVRDTVVSAA